jgi:hypothetical protein
VAVGGTTGQVLKKLSSTNYDTGWLTLPTDYITSVTAPLAVTAGDLSVDLSAYSTTAQAAALYYPLSGNPSAFITASALTPYLPLAGGAMTGSITSSTATYDTEMAGDLFGVQLSADHSKGTTVQFNGLDTYDGASHMLVTPTGLTFPDATVQTTAGLTDAPSDGSTYGRNNGAWAVAGGGGTWGSITGTLSAQTDLQSALDARLTDAPSDGSTYGRNNGAWAVAGGGPAFIESVTSPLVVTGTDLSIDLTGYATESFVTSQGYITQATADGLYYPLSGNPSAFVDSAYVTGLGYITDATADGTIYGRKDNAWIAGTFGDNLNGNTLINGSIDLLGTGTCKAESFTAGSSGSFVFGIYSAVKMDLSGFTFADNTTQVTAGITQATADGLYYSITNPSAFVDSAYVAGLGYVTQATADGLYYSITNPSAFVDSAYVTGLGYVPDAPSDGNYYVRKNGAWYVCSTASVTDNSSNTVTVLTV